MKSRIGRRLKTRRESLNLTQETVAEAMGLSRQILARIEKGERQIRPPELAAVARMLQVDPDFFVDPFSAAGEASFSFRADGADPKVLEEFEDVAGRWIATYRELGRKEGKEEQFLIPSLSLNRWSSYEDAHSAAAQVRQDLKLGRVPAKDLSTQLSTEWGILVLFVNAPEGVSGAASRLDGHLRVILVNRHEPIVRQNWNVAHELFHVLTWDSIPPRKVESSVRKTGRRDRTEELADNFAAELLMPEPAVREAWTRRGQEDVTEWMSRTAAEFRVSGSAMKWRAVNLGLISRSAAPDDCKVASVDPVALGFLEPPPQFNLLFVHRIHAAVEEGRLSLRKACRILGLDSSEFVDLCRSYGRHLSYEV